jgi:hypothetical protein
MKLCITLATRSRPQQVVETITKSTANLVLDNTVFMVQVDDDDKATIEALHAAPLDSRVQVHVHPRPDTIASKWNRALITSADVYLVAADDDPYITPGYDKKVLDAATLFPDGIGMVYGRMANASFSGAVCPTAKFCEALGHIFPEYFPYWFVDHWTDDVARLIGRISFADIATDQSKAGRTQEMREPGWWATWFDAAYLMRRRIAQKIIIGDDFQECALTKQRLLHQAPLIEYRSKWINDNVRAMSPQVEWSMRGNPPDERYLRIKQRAIDIVPDLLADLEPAEAHKYRTLLTPPTKVVGLQRAWA